MTPLDNIMECNIYRVSFSTVSNSNTIYVRGEFGPESRLRVIEYFEDCIMNELYEYLIAYYDSVASSGTKYYVGDLNKNLISLKESAQKFVNGNDVYLDNISITATKVIIAFEDERENK